MYIHCHTSKEAVASGNTFFIIIIFPSVSSFLVLLDTFADDKYLGGIGSSE